MRAYLDSFALVLVAALLMAELLFLLGAGVVVRETFWAARASAKKAAAAEAIAGPKIVIVAGSNAHFGLRADLIAAATRRPAVNLATHAGFGAPYVFYLAKQVLRRGDIAILPLEYETYLGSAPLLNTLNVGVSYSHGLDYFRALDPLSELRYLRELRPRQVWHGAMIRLGLEAAPTQSPDGYQPATIDRWGDETEDASAAVPAENIRDFEHRICPGLFFPEASGIAALRAFVAWAKAEGVSVLATWPNIVRDACEENAAFATLNDAVRALYRELGVPMVGTPEEAFLAVELMRDSVYHPRLEGATLRTLRFVAELCAETPLCAGAKQ